MIGQILNPWPDQTNFVSCHGSVSSLIDRLTRVGTLTEVNIAIKIHSEISGHEIWFCSNEEMAREIKRRNLKARTYTINEIKEAIELAPDSQVLKQLQDKFGNLK